MPTYEYACRDCGEHLEIVQSFKDDALTTCPSCEGSLRKVFSAAGIIFKGSGWHIKDYGTSGSSTTAASSDDASSSGDAAGDAGGSDKSGSDKSGSSDASSAGAGSSSGSSPSSSGTDSKSA